MSGIRERAQRRKLQELTSNDFANSTSPRDKYRKSIGKKIKICQITDQINKDEIDVNKTSRNPRRNSINNTNNNNNEEDDSNHVYNDYHVDIWFLISEYIRPEDVGRFALICKKTDYVVSTVKFWKNLYYSYSNSKFFKIDFRHVNFNIFRVHIIQSLFFNYSPFSKRMNKSKDISNLEGLRFLGAWTLRRTCGICTVYYHFTNDIKTRTSPKHDMYKDEPIYISSDDDDESSESEINSYDHLNDPCLEKFFLRHSDLFKNLHEGHCLLTFSVEDYVPNLEFNEPAYLYHIRQTLTTDLQEHNLCLEFVNSRNQRTGSITYRNIYDLSILDWWHPGFNISL